VGVPSTRCGGGCCGVVTGAQPGPVAATRGAVPPNVEQQPASTGVKTDSKRIHSSKELMVDRAIGTVMVGMDLDATLEVETAAGGAVSSGGGAVLES
jgi:hypothetical protein